MVMQDLFRKYGVNTRGLPSVTPRETLELLQQGALIVDLRETGFADFKAFGVNNVINAPLSNFDEAAESLDPNAHYILADSSGLKTRLCAGALLDKGFQHVAIMGGGFIEWERDGLPVFTDVNERLSGPCPCQLKARERKKT